MRALQALSLATSLNRLASGTVASTTLPLRKALGITNFFLFYACVLGNHRLLVHLYE